MGHINTSVPVGVPFTPQT